MHSDPSVWRAKVEKLQSLIRHLRTVIIHVNANISDDLLFNNIALVQQLKGVSVSAGYCGAPVSGTGVSRACGSATRDDPLKVSCTTALR